jgi:formylglycine-generating enzyme required for sulfatase activity
VENKSESPKVFISYSHDSAEHRDRVLALSDRLRKDGVDCVIDRYETSPPEGWPRWMRRQIHESHFTLVVCTATYERRFNNDEEIGVGLGVKFEGAVMTQTLYQREMRNERFIPVVFSAEDARHRPDLLHGATFYRVDTPEGYENLYRHLTNQPEVVKPPLGTTRPLPPRSQRVAVVEQPPAVVQPPVAPQPHVAAPVVRAAELPKTFKNAIGMEFVLIPPGEFLMGSEKNDGEKPVHKVTIGYSFYLGKYQVTQGEWKAVMGDNPSWFKGDDRRPVEKVSWDDCQRFLERLNAKNDGWKYRLPSEAEWEYACRAGTTGDYAGDLDAMAWYGAGFVKFILGIGGTHRVGQKQPNAFGIYDMHGNVWEWCQDRTHENYNGAPTDGSAWEDGSDNRRILRGGSWADNAYYCRSANRNFNAPALRYNDSNGFRLVAARIP